MMKIFSTIMIATFCMAFVVSAQDPQPTKIEVRSVSQIPSDSILCNGVVTLKNMSVKLTPTDSVMMAEDGTPLTRIQIRSVSQISRDSMITLYKKNRIADSSSG